jgi:hypothetical protein
MAAKRRKQRAEMLTRSLEITTFRVSLSLRIEERNCPIPNLRRRRGWNFDV